LPWLIGFVPLQLRFTLVVICRMSKSALNLSTTN